MYDESVLEEIEILGEAIAAANAAGAQPLGGAELDAALRVCRVPDAPAQPSGERPSTSSRKATARG